MGGPTTWGVLGRGRERGPEPARGEARSAEGDGALRDTRRGAIPLTRVNYASVSQLTPDAGHPPSLVPTWYVGTLAVPETRPVGATPVGGPTTWGVLGRGRERGPDPAGGEARSAEEDAIPLTRVNYARVSQLTPDAKHLQKSRPYSRAQDLPKAGLTLARSVS